MLCLTRLTLDATTNRYWTAEDEDSPLMILNKYFLCHSLKNKRQPAKGSEEAIFHISVCYSCIWLAFYWMPFVMGRWLKNNLLRVFYCQYMTEWGKNTNGKRFIEAHCLSFHSQRTDSKLFFWFDGKFHKHSLFLKLGNEWAQSKVGMRSCVHFVAARQNQISLIPFKNGNRLNQVYLRDVPSRCFFFVLSFSLLSLQKHK